ncbi:PREDICTED: coiled-coil domain-containing protein 15 [Galeopterus variegatus]|uniref:Coiled-coil domain-containing protein 15 n=1 Tax=Galeopterus variegatus TaxID=482537 RepID=A0ABM0R4L9_GALVR|nr:PREDICTED: coiled-coil domain-containing protein 15 [Galeopterus variegatus]
MPGRMAPLKKSQKATRLPLALNPLKSKDVLAVLAERNQSVVPVGAWVEHASPDSSEIPAYTSAYMVEEKLKEQLRKKQEALKHFQRQVKHRVNQQIRLRKKQQLQKSYEAAEKEGCIAMQSSDPAHLTPKRTSVFANNLNGAIGISRLPPSQMLGDEIEDRENQNELFQQQAQALSQTMKQARHRLASFKTVSKKKASVFPDGRRKSFSTQEEPNCEESSSVMTDEKGRDLLWGEQQDLLSEDKDKPFSRVQKVKFKNPLFVVMEEEGQKQLHLKGLQDILPEAQNYLPEAQGDLKIQGDLTGIQSVELEAHSVESDSKAVEPEGQAVEPQDQAVKTETQGIMLKSQNTELENGNIVVEAQDFLLQNQIFLPKNLCVLPKDQNILPKCQDQDFVSKDQDFLPRDQHLFPKDQNILPNYQDQEFFSEDQDFLRRDQRVFPKDQNIVPKCQDQNFLPKDWDFLLRDQHVLPKDQNIVPECQDQDFLPKDQDFLPRDQCVFPKDQNILHKYQDQDFLSKDQELLPRDLYVLPKNQNIQPKCQDQDFLPKDQDFLPRDQNILPKCQDQDFLCKDQKVHFKEPHCDMTDEEGREGFSPAGCQYLPPKPQKQNFIRDQHRNNVQASHDMTDERWRKELFPESHVYILHEIQDPGSAREQSLYFRQQLSVGTAEKCQEDLLLDRHQHLPSRNQRDTSSRQQVYNEYQSGMSTEFQALLAFRSGIDQEEDKKEGKICETSSQNVKLAGGYIGLNLRGMIYDGAVALIKKKKEQQRYAEEQRILKTNFNEEPYSGEKMSDMLAQLQLEEIKTAREKQQQREKEYLRYVEALRAQIQEKMQLYNITLPPLCCCGPDFWDAHPNTCANNCIFYKNHRAYTRALHSVINSCDISEGSSTLRNAIHNFASAHRRTLKNL